MTQIETTHTEIRRLRVASLYLRGLTPMEITTALARNGLRDPVSQLPYSVQVISDDVLHLEGQWVSDMEMAQRTRRARMLAELDEARRLAWSKGNVNAVLRCLKQEAELLGKEATDTGGDEEIVLFSL